MDECRVLDTSFQCETNLVRSRTCEAGQRLALPDGAFDHEVEPLAGPLYQSTAGKGFRQPAVPWVLLVDDVIRIDTGGKSARADNFQPPGELAKKYGAAKTVVAVGNGVEQRLAD